MRIDLILPMLFDDDEMLRMSYFRRFRCTMNSGVRFRSYGTERLLVRCIKRFMPWVDKIFIILTQESQKRSWMDEEGVSVVYHKDFIPKEYLPVFNSCTIEMFLPFISELSEYFVYGNDDMFPLSPLNETDFFVDGKPCIKINKKEWPTEQTIFHAKCINQQKMVSAYFGQNYDNIWLHGGHSLMPLLKSECFAAHKAFKNQILNGITPSRSVTSYSQYLYMLWHYFKGVYVDKAPVRKYLNANKDYDDIATLIGKDDCGILCINDSDNLIDFDAFAQMVREAITNKLNKN